MIEGYLLEIHNASTNHKEFAKLESKLQNRRLDYDAKLNKLQKSKKENPALEEEVRVAQAKYEESLEAATTQMIDLNSQDEHHHYSFSKFIELEMNYYEKCAELLRNLRSVMDEVHEHEVARPSQVQRLKETIGREGSLSRNSVSSAHSTNSGFKFEEVNSRSQYSPEPLHANNSREIGETQVRALYDFDAENQGELTSKLL
jgi:uncharacterized protein YcbK (DUF882 family)